MGTCASCCGKADSNEIVTEKKNQVKGVNAGNNQEQLIDEVKKAGRTINGNTKGNVDNFR